MLGKLARQHDPNVLVGFDTADDAGVYRLSDSLALVQTVDFFTPVVDDPYTFGQIAAVNSLSDVYAMGGEPRTALAMVCFPEKADLAILERILAGGLSKMIEAGCSVIGGHSVRDDEVKFGYAVTGVIDPRRVLTNSGAQPGDRLLLTKAIGTGVIATAIKRGEAKQEWIDAASSSMTTLNKTAAEVIRRGKFASDGTSQPYAIHALTDVTGFGLIGHLREMVLGSKVGARLFANRVPLLPGALECVRAGFVPAGLTANRDFAECVLEYEDANRASSLSEEVKTLLFDPQTAGGLLIAVAEADASGLSQVLQHAGVPAVEIGEVVTTGDARIIVTS